MIAGIEDLAGDLVQELGYVGLVLLMAVEHIFPPIPSELVLPLAGFEVGRGNLNFAGALAASTFGSLIGASVLYGFARRGGRPLILRLHGVLRFDEASLDRAERHFERHSAWIVVLGRMVPGIRSAVSVPPGLLRMPYRRYLLLTLAGSLVWNAALIFAGQQLGTHWKDVAHVVEPIAQWVLVAIVPLLVVGLLMRRRAKRP
ncbi:MAG TPA: DedA family protein [Solirubrobacteraceae bacterium]|nr:DedA family protein [Solirubrobacteraceae bacterium]